jgi:DNA-binding SARP family transcriptional activator
MLNINLFGTGEARYYDRPLPGFPTQQPCVLLCHLLLNKTYPHNREHLASLFWSDSPNIQARKSLRNALWRLRQLFQSVGAPPEEYLFITEESVSFINTSSHRLDVELFETSISQCQDISARDLTVEQASNLQSAVDLYKGDLLDSIYADWILYDRERLRLLYLSALNKLMLYHGMHSSYERGLICGERILAYDNSREKVHRQMMWLYYLQGNRTAALAQYKKCHQILQDELGVQPMEETRLLYDQMVHNKFNASHWMVDAESPAPDLNPREGSMHSIAELALKRLHHLQVVIDETSAELRLLERLIDESISRTGEI